LQAAVKKAAVLFAGVRGRGEEELIYAIRVGRSNLNVLVSAVPQGGQNHDKRELFKCVPDFVSNRR